MRVNSQTQAYVKKAAEIGEFLLAGTNKEPLELKGQVDNNDDSFANFCHKANLKAFFVWKITYKVSLKGAECQSC